VTSGVEDSLERLQTHDGLFTCGRGKYSLISDQTELVRKQKSAVAKLMDLLGFRHQRSYVDWYVPIICDFVLPDESVASYCEVKHHPLLKRAVGRASNGGKKNEKSSPSTSSQVLSEETGILKSVAKVVKLVNRYFYNELLSEGFQIWKLAANLVDSLCASILKGTALHSSFFDKPCIPIKCLHEDYMFETAHKASRRPFDVSVSFQTSAVLGS
jgi:hypothetical protein